MYDQKEIVLVPFPYSNLTDVKQRPALIISNKITNKMEDRICCFVTSNPSKDGVKITNNCFEKSTLPFQSWVKPHRLFTIHKGIIKKRLCIINDDFCDKIIQTVNKYIKRD